MSIEDATPEIWCSIPGYSGYYEASSYGAIRSLDRWVETSDGRRRFWPGQLLRQSTSWRYPSVTLYRNGKSRSQPVHRLVLEAHRGACPPGKLACHRDDVRTNNMLFNLRWATPSENNLDAVRNGHHGNASKVVCLRGHAFNATNTYVNPSNGQRQCRHCNRRNRRRRRSGLRGDQ